MTSIIIHSNTPEFHTGELKRPAGPTFFCQAHKHHFILFSFYNTAVYLKMTFLHLQSTLLQFDFLSVFTSSNNLSKIVALQRRFRKIWNHLPSSTLGVINTIDLTLPGIDFVCIILVSPGIDPGFLSSSQVPK